MEEETIEQWMQRMARGLDAILEDVEMPDGTRRLRYIGPAAGEEEENERPVQERSPFHEHHP